MKAVASVDELFELLQGGGGAAYFGEPVTVLEHCLQAAWFIECGVGGDSLVAAALLHDLGHLLHGEGEDAAEHGLDTHHEELAGAALAGRLPESVLDPIRMHVAAKRYLCFADADYLGALSPASVQSLALQGGPMSAAEAEAFLALPYAREALALRRADDAAKVSGLQVPGLAEYRPIVERLWI
jgi:phosphonate degradation associated HDIG domain protein